MGRLRDSALESELPHVASISRVIYTLGVTQTIVWFTEYCGYEGLVDVRCMLNMTREADRIRNDLAVGPALIVAVEWSVTLRAIRLS